MVNAAAGAGAAIYLAFSETRLAGELGGDYRERTRLLPVGRWGMRAFGSRMTTGRGCLLLFFGSWVIYFVLWLPALLYGLIALLQMRSVRRRRREWLLAPALPPADHGRWTIAPAPSESSRSGRSDSV